jgi:hypothetical protein
MGLALVRTAHTGIERRPNDLWVDEYKALLVKQAACARQEEAACRPRILDELAARACQQEAARQEAACTAQHLLHKRVALERQGEAAPCQHLLDKWSALRRCAAQARHTAASRVNFLWLRRLRLFAWLACQILR